MARVVLVLAMALCIAAINGAAAQEPDTSADTAAPQASEESPAPTVDTSADTAAPQAAEESPAPDNSGDTSAPQAAEESPAPDNSGDTAAPQAAEESPAPDTSGDTAAPQAAGESPTPDTSGDTAAPQAAGESPTPDTSGDTAAPQAAGETPAPFGSVTPPPATTTAAPEAQCVRATFTIVGNFNELQQNATEWSLLLEALRRDLANVGITVNSLSATTLENGSLAVTAGVSSGSNAVSVDMLVSRDWLQRVKALYAAVASGDLSVVNVAGQLVPCASANSGDLKSASAPVQVVGVAAVALATMLWLA